MRALEESGIITGYRALLDGQVGTQSDRPDPYLHGPSHPGALREFREQVSDLPEVLECLLITGQDADYQLKVVVRDMQATRNCC